IFQLAFGRPSSYLQHNLPQPDYDTNLDDIDENAFKDLIERSLKSKKWIKFSKDNNNEDRRKKFLESAHSLQGLWAMPGK
ncbi:unnamed protein product, partial [Didymodactylos carnosus]